MPLTVPHTEVQNISTLNFTFKLMPPHKHISLFKGKKKDVHGQSDSRKPNHLKLLLLSITTTAQNPAAQTREPQDHANLPPKKTPKTNHTPLVRIQFPSRTTALQIRPQALQRQAGAEGCCPCWPQSCGVVWRRSCRSL